MTCIDVFMKRILYIFIAIFPIIFSGCRGNNSGSVNSSKQTDSSGVAEIVFREYEHDFGKVKEGEKVAYVFSFENKGTGNLVVTNAITTCGCTVPKYDNKPIAPGGIGNLEVIFDTYEKNGMQSKTISVRSNASKPVVILKITAEVVSNIN
jgi:hypothetical protein